MWFRLGAIVIVVGVCVGVGYVYKDTRAQNAAMKIELETLQATNDRLARDIEQMEKSFEAVKEASEKLAGRMASAEEELSNATKIFREHDLQNLTRAKPNLIERRMNDATENLLDSITDITRP